MKYLKFLPLIFLALFIACGDDDSVEQQQSQDNFDRGAMLVNWADNIILPSYISFDSDLEVLQSATANFIGAPNENTLLVLRNEWEVAYKSFQKVSMFEIGKAETLNYRNRLNVYPANAQEIEDFIAAGDWNFSLPSTIDAQGFPALDYLLNGLGNDQETIVAFTSNPNSENYKNYLNELVVTIRSLTGEVISDWQNGFRETYVTNTSSSASGSVDKTTNAIVFYYEKALRAGKVGIPAGVFSNTPLPQNVEAFYKSDISKELLEVSLEAFQSFFNGKNVSTGAEGESFKSYLTFLNTIKNGEDLSTLINNQFNSSFTEISALLNDFSQQIIVDNSKMLNTYDALQRNVILIKVDMLQALSIDVNYVDADGD